MANKLELKSNYNIALIGGDRFARCGIVTLLQGITPDIRIETSDSDYSLLDNLLTTTSIDILFVSGAEKYHAGFDCLSYIKKNQGELSGGVCLYVFYPGELFAVGTW